MTRHRMSGLSQFVPVLAPIGVLFALVATDVLTGVEHVGNLTIFGWAAYCVTVFCRTGILSVPLLLLGRRSRWFYLPFVVLATVTVMVQVFVRLKFSMNLDGDLLGIIWASSPDEALRFFGGMLSVGIFLGLLSGVIAGAVAVRVFWKMRPKNSGTAGGLLSVLLVGMACGWFRDSLSRPVSFLESSPMCNFWYDTLAHYDDYAGLKRLVDAPNLPAGIRMEKTLDESPFVVFVLGESATRNRWSLYGYGRPTTPRMDGIRDELVVFSDFVASASNTGDAMRLLLTEATQEKPMEMNCTLAQVLQAAGYRCVLFSAQARWGAVDGLESYAFGGCEQMRFMSEEGLPEPWFDDALLRYLDEEIGRGNGCPTVVFLHLRGSHLPPQDNYPPSEARFAPENHRRTVYRMTPSLNVNNYDNTIAFTDRLLGDIVDRLRSMQRPTLMFYLSDHGESVDSDGWRVLSDLNVWELPMICWLSPSFRERCPETVLQLERAKDRPLQTEGLLHGLVSLLQVGGYGRPEDSFLAAEWRVRKRLIQKGKVEYRRER